MTNSLIHAAHIHPPKKGKTLLCLRKCSDHEFRWYLDKGDGCEEETEVVGETPQEALQLAHSRWKLEAFRPVGCGFRYTLPERDEHGMNALFHQMVSSLSTMNETYFDEELGHNCFVQNASDEAIELWRRLQEENRL